MYLASIYLNFNIQKWQLADGLVWILRNMNKNHRLLKVLQGLLEDARRGTIRFGSVIGLYEKKTGIFFN